MPRPLARPLRHLAATTWTPRLDIYEKGGQVLIKAELPGMKKEDIEVALEDGDVLIRGAHIDVWVPTCREAKIFGRQKGTAMLLPRPEIQVVQAGSAK